MNDKDILISQFIDNELSLDEKSVFVREINKDDGFCGDTLSMLETEKQLTPVTDIRVPEIASVKAKTYNYTAIASFTALAASLLVMVKVFMFAPQAPVAPTPQAQVRLYQRFVIHAPEARNVALTGSFSDWKQMKMTKTANGYWEITVPLNKGEYIYSYIINGNEQLADPSVPAKQTDDFGGENSVLHVGDRI